MADPVEVENSAAEINGKTLVLAEAAQEISGLKSFVRAPDAPFDVEAGSAHVPNLDADKLDGEHGADFHNASLLAAGTLPAARFPAVLPACSAEALTSIPAPNLTGLIPATSLADPLPAKSLANATAMPATLPATSLANCTSVPGSQISGKIPDASVPTYVDNAIVAGKKFSRGGPVHSPNGILAGATLFLWKVTVACHVKKVGGIRTGGTSCKINAQRNGSEKFLASDLSLANPGTWYDGGAVQNDALAVGDTIQMMVIDPAGSPTEVVVQIDLEKDNAAE